jgi:hypothetical protein
MDYSTKSLPNILFPNICVYNIVEDFFFVVFPFERIRTFSEQKLVYTENAG